MTTVKPRSPDFTRGRAVPGEVACLPADGLGRHAIRPRVWVVASEVNVPMAGAEIDTDSLSEPDSVQFWADVDESMRLLVSEWGLDG